MITTRRKFIGGISLLVAAPAIVPARSIMPVKAYPTTIDAYGVTPAANIVNTALRSLSFTIQVSTDGGNWITQKQTIPLVDYPEIITLPRPEGGRYFRFATSISPTAAGESAA